jgi:hypothetical protein
MRPDREHMTRETLEQLIASGEGLRTEFKETTGQRNCGLVPLSRCVVAEASRSDCLPCRGGEGGESARLGEAPQSTNLDSGDWMGLLRRMGDAAMPETFYTFSTSTRLNKGGVVLPCRGEEAVESACPGEAHQSTNLDSGDWMGLLRRMGDAAMPETFYTFSKSTRGNGGRASLMQLALGSRWKCRDCAGLAEKTSEKCASFMKHGATDQFGRHRRPNWKW